MVAAGRVGGMLSSTRFLSHETTKGDAMSLQSNASAVGWTSIKTVSGVDVDLSRSGGGGPSSIVAVAGDTMMEVMDAEGQTVRLKVRDYIVGRAEFEAIIGSGEKPDRGDVIVETVGGFSRTYEAIEVGGEVSRWWDKSGIAIRIHTTETAQATTTTTAGA